MVKKCKNLPYELDKQMYCYRIVTVWNSHHLPHIYYVDTLFCQVI